MQKIIPALLSSMLLSAASFAAESAEIPRVTAPELSSAIINQVIIPEYVQLEAASQQLRQANQNLCQNLTPEALQQAQQAYVATLLAWRKIEIAPIGPSNNVNNGLVLEAAPAKIAQIIQQSSMTPEHEMSDGEALQRATSLPKGSIGLPAISALLYNGTPTQSIATLKQTCAYLNWQSQVAARQIVTQQYEWRGLSRGIMYDMSYPSRFITEYFNKIIAGARSMPSVKLKGEPNTWQDAATNQTAAGINANIAGLKALLRGNANDVGLDDYLISRGQSALWDKVARQLAQLEAAGRLLQEQINAQNAAHINRSSEALAATLQTEVAKALNIRTEK